MKAADLVAIDVHTHAWKSALAMDDAPSERQEAMGRYFRYQPQHATVPQMAEYYRKLKMAFVVCTVDRVSEKGKITNEEIAAYLSVSPTTVESDWRHARAWLKRRLEGH